ncbi:MAG: peptidase M50 [Chloroflexaceae bacterium]
MPVRDIFTPPADDIGLRGKNEPLELLKAWGGTSLAFAIYLVGGQVLNPTFWLVLLAAAVTCGAGFMVHELAHRMVARHFGATAHFVANNPWLLISIALAFLRIFIAAPGAVWHQGYLTPRQSGLIALVGPASNLALALLFLGALWLVPPGIVVLGLPLSVVLRIGYSINAWIGLFNMIPAGPFDGAKVLAWDWRVFGVTVAIGLLLTFVIRV